MSTIDPRRGKPSASGMGRLIECRFSHQMEQRIPDTESKDSSSGDKVHAVLAGTAPASSLDIHELHTFEMCVEQEERLLREWSQGEEPARCFREIRLGLTTFGTVIEVTPESRADFVFTAQLDVLYVQGKRGLVIDFKSLYGDTPEAVDNAQLASQAVLAALRFDTNENRVAIVQPRVGKPTVSDYSEKALALSVHWLNESLKNAEEATEADIKPGPWCKFCRARIICERFKAQALDEIEVVQPMTLAGMDGKTQRAAMYQRVLELPPARHAAAWEGLVMVKRYVDAVESATQDRADCDPEFQKFVQLVDGRQGNREIGDAQKAFEALAPLGVTADDMMAAAKLSVTRVQEAVRIRSGIKSVGKVTKYNLTVKEAGEKMEEALGDLMTRKDSVRELVSVRALGAGREDE